MSLLRSSFQEMAIMLSRTPKNKSLRVLPVSSDLDFMTNVIQHLNA